MKSMRICIYPKEGDLEFYLGITGHKESAKVIDFCNNVFASWVEKFKQGNQKNWTLIFDRIFA